MTKKTIVITYDRHLDDMGYYKYRKLKGEPMTKHEFHHEVYDIGLKVLEKQYKNAIRTKRHK